MKKQLLKERFQQLAGIKPLYETDYADRLANSGTDSDGRNTWGDKTGYSDEEMAQGKGKLKKYPDKDGRNVWGDKTDYSEPRVEIRAAAVLSHDEYKSVYFGDKEDFEENGFEFIETFNPSSPYTFVMWNNEDLSVSDFDSEEEFIEEFSEMGFGGCDEEECGIAKIIEVINNASADGSNYGLALLANGEEIANGGE